jgi:cell division protein FtsB
MVRPVTMFIVVLLVLAALITPYFRSWMTQRDALAVRQQQADDLQREVEALEREKARWDDPEYVRAQARDRLNFVMPGDTGYVLLTPQEDPTPQDPRDEAAEVAGSATDAVWYEAFWQSVTIAGTVPDEPVVDIPGSGR